MPYRLGQYVVYGEIRNTCHYSTAGVIALRGDEPGRETIVRLELTGNCNPDLRGKHIRFGPPEDEADDGPVFRIEEHRGFRLQQIGPTGTMTASGWARAFGCPPEEFLRRLDLGEPPPTEWKRRLYLEWCGQNGPVVVEMADMIVEECVRPPAGKDDEGEWVPLPNAAPCPSPGAPAAAGPDITLMSVEGDDVHIERWVPRAESSDCDETDNALIPDTLQQALDAQAAAVDRAIRGEDEGSDDVLADMELMDDLIERGDGKPVSSLIGDVAGLPRPETLDDEEVESQLKILLARLAAVNVTLDVCEHSSPRDCYQLLLDKILTDCTAYEEMIGTAWVTHVGTYDYCPGCEAEFDEAFPDEEDEDHVT